jgi:hypothetical protein
MGDTILGDTGMTAAPELVRRVVEEVEGYPYFIQPWGLNCGTQPSLPRSDRLDLRLLEATTPDIYRRLDIDFYEPRVSALTPAEQDVLLASASWRDLQHSKGQYEYTAPKFREYLTRRLQTA